MIGTAQKVRFLADPRSYPDRPASVEVVETHMSWVFLAGSRVYKFKKPLAFPFLDHRTLRARQHDCREEFALNRVLADETYLGVVPLVRGKDGRLHFDGDGVVVEWLVAMKRLSSEKMLSTRIARGQVTQREVRAAARRLCAFYAAAGPERTDGGLYLRHLHAEQAVNRALLTSGRFALDPGHVGYLLDALESLFARVEPEIRARTARELLVDGHGDLRPDHVWLGHPLQIIDRLEFDRSMRILDPYDEVNALALECRVLGADWIGPLLLETLQMTRGAPPSPVLMRFYTAFRAVLRARICLAHLLDPVPMTPAVWPGRAQAYFAQADLALDALERGARTDQNTRSGHSGRIGAGRY